MRGIIQCLVWARCYHGHFQTFISFNPYNNSSSKKQFHSLQMEYMKPRNVHFHAESGKTRTLTNFELFPSYYTCLMKEKFLMCFFSQCELSLDLYQERTIRKMTTSKLLQNSPSKFRNTPIGNISCKIISSKYFAFKTKLS